MVPAFPNKYEVILLKIPYDVFAFDGHQTSTAIASVRTLVTGISFPVSW